MYIYVVPEYNSSEGEELYQYFTNTHNARDVCI